MTLFRTDDLDALGHAIRDLCLAEGLVTAPYVRRKREKWDRMQYGTGATSDRWALAFGTGLGGWSVVKTAPLELLAEPGTSGEHRLGLIARVLGCDALHISLYGSTAMVIAQAAPTGKVMLSGYTLDGLLFHGVEIEEQRFKPTIEGARISPAVGAALERSASDGFNEVIEQLAGQRWVDISLKLIEGEEVPSARVLSFARPGLEKRTPLRLKLKMEEHPLGTRYVMDDGVWINDSSIDAANSEVGAAFVEKVARWLGVPVSLEPGVPRSLFCVRATPSEPTHRVGFETEVVSIGDDGGCEFLLHTARGLGIAELEERSPHQRRRLVAQLTRALVGTRAHVDATYRDFKRVFNEPTTHAVGSFAGERLATAWWRWGHSAVAIEGHEVFELPGLCTAIAGTHRQLALALVTPGFVNGRSQGYGQKDPAAVVVIDVDTGEVREVLRSDEHLTFGFAKLCFAGDVLGVCAERDGVPTVLTLEGGTRTESPGDFRAWAREAMQAPLGVDGLYTSYELPMLWAGPDAVMVVDEHAGEKRRRNAGAALAVLDLGTQERRPFCDAAGLDPIACSASGARCLARVDTRRLFVGKRVDRDA
ncbi:hypothetical protein [Corallococcus aberystwythensis]|uniref:Uncharacterized protein n=1 Tax=Corallococcus aberystwythensis TaxID=2316722 RepID=A0A3A8R0W0_9BACT|nr:hypothetical protein [Corallococcus aberystwythensis]RKH74679.1 hypothetical protein D7W81_00575 [Corallococcus aberystwythensis]